MVGAVEILWWWGVAVAIWLATLSSVTLWECVVAAACGLPCAVAARAGRRAVGGAWAPRLRWAAWALPWAGAVVADTARVLLVPLRRRDRSRPLGELREIELPKGESREVAAARVALATMALSATPGSFVVDHDAEEHTLVVHSLVEGHPRMEEVVGR
ncbi:hypothetical protein AB0436_07985 [Streptomyces sp. NPDC051322]|uniref:hypothetical protein n=1 Tax=Streptomyces sp. NPDC051322 TaxID=3154645 RepID=UPI00344FA64E